MEKQEIIKIIYNAFNRRDIDAVMAYLHPEVEWPNGWEGGYVYGHDAVRDYWTRQWAEIDPTVEPVNISFINDNEINVSVKQLVKDKAGAILFDGMVRHHYYFSGSLVTKMVICK
ncbi:nuclear transport factor 2 family protein [Mucilaginibacter ginkgonis]|uniref:Nuclear transport factor 2 family protein n=1 Tax=Mucilaginibacter ginkgonis TaxID=2682091 RepID=A0A6I4HZR2_9SPHI|nr:nuclear transport factor 2 family protein [Mucilaginibacter ginkgonis]QQL48756.1 nuclear transport factor 2 family protein [Mucilaginibacter ginkgonis]